MSFLTPEETERGLANLLGRTIPEVERGAAVWAALEADPAFVAGMDRGQADLEAGRFTPYRHIRAHGEGSTSFADVWQRRDDMRRDPGYATENVVPVDADMAQAMQAWVESMRWLGEDVA